MEAREFYSYQDADETEREILVHIQNLPDAENTAIELPQIRFIYDDEFDIFEGEDF